MRDCRAGMISMRVLTSSCHVPPMCFRQVGYSGLWVRWHNQNGARGMSHYLLCNAPDQHMFQTGEPVRRCNDQLDVVVFCKSADIQNRGAFSKDRLKFCAPKVYTAHNLSHLLLRIFASSLLQGANVI